MNQAFKKYFSIIIGIIKAIIFIVVFYRFHILFLFMAIILLTIIFIIEIIGAIKIKYSKILILITILSIIGIFPIMNIGNEFGPTFGNKIRYNKFLWDYSFNNVIKYYMADDIIKIIVENKYSKDSIIKMLGEPDFGYGSNEYTYILKYNSLIGFDMYILSIDFIDNKCNNAYILEMD
jgi:hypothetical protein